jgi:DNA-binding IclR family transcriptional regulator
METPGTTQQDGDEPDPVVIEILTQLWEASRDPAGKPWSLAKLSKRCGLSMSALLRNLTQLQTAQLVDVASHEDGTGSAALTAAGLELCAAVLGNS